MKFRYWAFAFFLLSSSRAHAQSPVAAGVAPLVRAEVGYTYVNVEIPGLFRVGLNGVEASFIADVNSHLGLKLDGNYARSADVYGSGHHADLLSYLAGPVIYPLRTQRLDLSAQVLLGGARQSGVNTNGQGGTLTGYVSQFAWLAGGGCEIHISRSTTIHVGVDYLHTKFFNPTTSLQGQNNIRSTFGIAYTFGGRRR